MAWSFALPPGARLAEPQRRQASLFRAVRQNFGFTEPPEPLVLVGKLGNAGNGVQNSLFFFVKKKSSTKRKSPSFPEKAFSKIFGLNKVKNIGSFLAHIGDTKKPLPASCSL